MKRKIKGVLLPLLAIVVSITLRIVSTTQMFDSILHELFIEERIAFIKEFIEIIDFTIFVVPLGIQAIVNANQASRCKEVISNFGQTQRELVFGSGVTDPKVSGDIDQK